MRPSILLLLFVLFVTYGCSMTREEVVDEVIKCENKGGEPLLKLRWPDSKVIKVECRIIKNE